MARQVGLCAAVTLALAGIALALLFSLGWGMVAVAGGTTGGVTLGLMYGYAANKRDRAVRNLVCLAYRAGGSVVGLSHLNRVLGTPDVLQAHSDALKAEAELLAQRYANGDASDY